MQRNYNRATKRVGECAGGMIFKVEVDGEMLKSGKAKAVKAVEVC